MVKLFREIKVYFIPCMFFPPVKKYRGCASMYGNDQQKHIRSNLLAYSVASVSAFKEKGAQSTQHKGKGISRTCPKIVFRNIIIIRSIVC